MKNISSTQRINIARKVVTSDDKTTYKIHTIKINGDVPASHRMVESEANNILMIERKAKLETIRKKKEIAASKEVKKKAEEAAKIIAQKESGVEETENMGSEKRKKNVSQKKVNNYVKHQ